MREHREAISSRGNSAVTTVTRSLIFMLVFCFAGCAAGSCLSYGHMCWGGHGKRSGHNNYPGKPASIENEDRRSPVSGGSVNDGESLQDRWILSRLVTRQLDPPTGEKFRENWYDSNRGRGHGRNWDSNDVDVIADNAKSIRRDEVEIEDDDEEDEIREEAVQVVPRVMSQGTREQVLEPRDLSEDEEVLLVPPSSSHLKPIGKSHKLRLFKILNGAPGKLD